MIKNKYLPFLAFLTIFLFLSANFAFALDIEYNGLPDNPTLFDFASFLFSWAIGIAGVLALISFTIGAVSLIISGDNPELASNSKDRMKGAILGLLLTLASFIIIQTINPGLITPLTPLTPLEIPPPGIVPGIYYYLNPDCEEGTETDILTTSRPKIENPSGEIACMKIVDDPANGIWYGVIIHAKAGLENGGVCFLPITSKETETVQIPANFTTFAADVFIINTKFDASSTDGVTFYSEPHGWRTGQDAGFLHIPSTSITMDTISTPLYANLMCFSYEGVKNRDITYWNRCCEAGTDCARPACECTSEEDIYNYGFYSQCCCACSNKACDAFKNCPGSIDKIGSYLIGLYSQTPSGELFCQTFTRDVENLKGEPYLEAGGKYVEMVYIIPIKE